MPSTMLHTKKKYGSWTIALPPNNSHNHKLLLLELRTTKKSVHAFNAKTINRVYFRLKKKTLKSFVTKA